MILFCHILYVFCACLLCSTRIIQWKAATRFSWNDCRSSTTLNHVFLVKKGENKNIKEFFYVGFRFVTAHTSKISIEYVCKSTLTHELCKILANIRTCLCAHYAQKTLSSRYLYAYILFINILCVYVRTNKTSPNQFYENMCSYKFINW